MWATKSLPSYQPLLSDLNGDCVVDDADLAILQSNWLKCSALNCNDVKKWSSGVLNSALTFAEDVII